MHIKKIEKQCIFGNGGTGRNYNRQICECLVKKIGDFLSKTIHSTGMPIHIIIRKMLFFHTFIRDSCSVGLLL